ncbi:hypothetical protein DJ526_10915, partial [Sulfolobus sp. A20-N-G8]
MYPNISTTGVYYIHLKIVYYNGVKQIIKVPIYIQSNNEISLEGIWGSLSNPEVVAPGENNVPLTLVVKNLGENLLSNVTLMLQSHYPIQFLQNNATVGFVPAGSYNYATVIANVYSNATPGVYYIPITVQIYNGYRQVFRMPVYILGYVNFSASSVWGTTSSPMVVGPGENNVPLTIILQNLGNSLVTNITLDLN